MRRIAFARLARRRFAKGRWFGLRRWSRFLRFSPTSKAAGEFKRDGWGVLLEIRELSTHQPSAGGVRAMRDPEVRMVATKSPDRRDDQRPD
jgi:hypothetical protein